MSSVTGNLCNKCPKQLIEQSSSYSDYFNAISVSIEQQSPRRPCDIILKYYFDFSVFDETIDKFDVYKVETIGDAYMVASGVPERNGVAHATEIAEMSLELVALIKEVAPINNGPEAVSLRIGIHSGTVHTRTRNAINL